MKQKSTVFKLLHFLSIKWFGLNWTDFQCKIANVRKWCAFMDGARTFAHLMLLPFILKLCALLVVSLFSSTGASFRGLHEWIGTRAQLFVFKRPRQTSAQRATHAPSNVLSFILNRTSVLRFQIVHNYVVLYCFLSTTFVCLFVFRNNSVWKRRVQFAINE